MDNFLTLEQIIDFLLGTPMFDALDPTELSQIVGVMQIQRVRAGHHVFHEGDLGDAWYVVYEGEAQVTKEGATGRHRSIAVLGARGCFGEMAVLDRSLRSASVRAVHDITVLRFPRAPFLELLEEGNLAAYKLVHAMARMLSGRQRSLTEQLSELVAERPDFFAHPSPRSSLAVLLDTYAVSG